MGKTTFWDKLRTTVVLTIAFLTFISAVGSGLITGCTQNAYYRTLHRHERQVNRRQQQRRGDVWWPQKKNRR